MNTMSMAILWLLLSLAFVLRMEAQPYDWQRCDTCYRNYSYTHGAGADSLFLFGAIGVPANLVGLAHDSMRVRELVEYDAPTIITNTALESVRLIRGILDSARVRGMKVRYPATTTANLAKFACRTFESYVGTEAASDSLQAYECEYFSTQGYADSTILPRDHVWGWRDDSTNGVHHLMVAKPRYTSDALISGGDIAISTDLYAKRNPISGPNADSTLYVRMTVTMTADSATLNRTVNPISPSDVIAFGVIYRRNTSGQTTCKCANYVVVDTLKITKAMLTDPAREPAPEAPGFSNFHSRYYHFPTEFPTVDGYLYANTSELCRDTCKGFRDTSTVQVIDERNSDNNIIVGSDRFVFRFYTVRVVPVRYLRTSIDQHSFMMLSTGQFDTLIKSEVDGVYNTPLLDTNYAGFGLTDEPGLLNYRAYGIISTKIQDFRYLQSPFDQRKIVSIGYASYGSRRAFSGDLYTRRYKLMQGITTDRYFTEGYYPIPIKYGNPDSTRGIGRIKAYRADVDSLTSTMRFPRMVFYNDTAGYNGYLRNLQIAHRAADSSYEAPQIGTFRDSRTSMSSNVGPYLSNLARAVDVSRYRNSQWGPGSPVYGIVTIHGRFNDGAYTGTFHIWPPTPEEITVQCWLALNCNVDGIVFSQFNWNGRELGLAAGDTTSNQNSEYALLKIPGNPTDSTRWIDTLWVGFASRLAAAQRFTAEMKRIDSVYQKLEYRREQMSVHDLGQSFNEIPMVDSIATERAVRDSLAFIGTNTFDDRASTYLEVTHLRPGPRDTNGLRTNARYLVITNRRCWPIDHGTYSVAAAHGGATTGFGNIDVRRPWITLKNSTGVMADSFIVEKVGRESEWHRTIAVGKPDSLDWLEPGWGQLYRLRPVPTGVAPNGTAYNNAVHSVNPSKPALAHDRIVVFERDSMVYLQTMDPTGAWSAERLISDATDTLDIGTGTWLRTADNMHPAVAVSNDGDSTLVVWERHENIAGTIVATVEGCIVKGLPDRGTFPGTIRVHLGSPITLSDTSWMKLTPAVVGIGKKAWVVAWANPAVGIEACVVRANPSTVTTPVQIAAAAFDYPFMSSTASLYPTLAYGRRQHSNASTQYHSVHLAWQQGPPGGSTHIFYSELALHIGLATIGTRKVEHVCQGIPGCNFRHPSIATDAARTGVSFEIWSAGARSTVGLRFRDSLDTNLPARLPWSNAVYRWGGFTVTRTRFQIQKFTKLNYERPSLTEFPRLNRSETAPKAKGVLAWQWTNPPSGRHNGQLAYQFGWFRPRTLPDGQNPSMMLVPFDTVSPYSATSVFYRGENSLAFTRSRPWMGTTTSYPGMLENTPATPVWLFSRLVRDTGICSYVQFGFGDYVSAVNCDNTHGDGLHIGIIFDSLRVTSLNFPEPDAHERGLSPAFFGPSEDGTQRTDSIQHVGRIIRTGSFMPDTGSVTIRRIMFGTDSLVSYLNAAPYDSTLGTAGNILAWLELVDANNGTVLWRGDTLSARVIADSGRDDRVTIPVGAIASGGTPVYIRMAARTTANLGHTLSGGYYFLEDSIGVDAISKRTFPAQPATPSTGTVPGSLEISVIPNPARTSAELHLVVRETGDIHVAIHDMLGQVVRDVPLLKAEQAGEYTLPLDLAGLPVGSYLIVARGPVGQTTSRFTVDQ